MIIKSVSPAPALDLTGGDVFRVIIGLAGEAGHPASVTARTISALICCTGVSEQAQDVCVLILPASAMHQQIHHTTAVITSSKLYTKYIPNVPLL